MARVPVDVTLLTDVAGVPHFDASDTVTVWSDAALSSALTVWSAESGGVVLTQPLSLANGGLTASGGVNGFVTSPTEIYVHVVGTTTTYHRPGIHSSDLAGSVSLSTVNNWSALNTFAAGLKIGTAKETSGTGSPEGAVTGNVGDKFIRTDGGAGTTEYWKEVGSGNTGWMSRGSGTSGGGALSLYVDVSQAPYNATTNDTGDNTAKVNQAITDMNAIGGGAVHIPGTVRCLGSVHGQDRVEVRGNHKGGSYLHFPNDLGWGRYAVEDHGSGAQYPPVIRNLTILGPGASASFVPGQHPCNMDGVEFQFNTSMFDSTVMGFNAGVVMLADHNNIERSKLSSCYYAMWWKDGPTAFGNINVRAVAMDGNWMACVCVGGDNDIDYGYFEACDFSLTPYAFLKTDRIEEGRRFFDCTTTSGSATISSPTATFTSADATAHKPVNIDGWNSTIQTYNSPSSVTLATPVPFSRAGNGVLGISTAGNTWPMMTNTRLIMCGIEETGNGAIRDESSGGYPFTMLNCLIDPAGYTHNPSGRIANRPYDWAVETRLCRGVTIVGGASPFFSADIGTFNTDTFDLVNHPITDTTWGTAANPAPIIEGTGSITHRSTDEDWDGIPVQCAGTVSERNILEWAPNFTGVQKFGTTSGTRNYAGVAKSNGVAGSTIAMARGGERVIVHSEYLYYPGTPVIPDPANGWQGIAAPGYFNTTSVLTPYATADPIIGFKSPYQGPSGGTIGPDGPIAWLKLLPPAPQHDFVRPTAPASLPAPAAALRGQFFRTESGGGDSLHICEWNGSAYVMRAI